MRDFLFACADNYRLIERAVEIKKYNIRHAFNTKTYFLKWKRLKKGHAYQPGMSIETYRIEKTKNTTTH
jgi:hypothetical protein